MSSDVGTSTDTTSHVSSTCVALVAGRQDCQP